MTQNILSQQQVEAISEVAEHPRNELLPKFLFELGIRLNEARLLDRSDLTKDADSWKISVRNQMTGEIRKLTLQESAPELENWLENHPRSEEDSPLLVDRNGNRITAHIINTILSHLGEKAKKSNKQLFGSKFEPKKSMVYNLRRSSAHHKINNDPDFNEAKVKWWFGWKTGRQVEFFRQEK